MEGRKSRHTRATIYLVIADIFMLLFLYGLFFDVLECSFWGFLGCSIFGFMGIFTADDELNEGNNHDRYYDCYGDDNE